MGHYFNKDDAEMYVAVPVVDLANKFLPSIALFRLLCADLVPLGKTLSIKKGVIQFQSDPILVFYQQEFPLPQPWLLYSGQ